MQKKSYYEVKAGDKFGRLTLTGVIVKKLCSDGRRTMYEAKCECGDVRYYLLKFLVRGDTKSCGCLRNDMISKAKSKHHMSKHPLYSVYQDMKTRCYSPRCKAYKDYGGRANPITVCEEWLNDIFAFVNWGINNGYKKGLQIDRINNDGNYEPSNCRFATKQVSNSNTRRNVFIEIWGERKTITDWSRDKRCKVNWNTLKGRIKRGFWDIEKAMTTRPGARSKEIQRNSTTARHIAAWGESKSIIEWSEDKRCNTSYAGLKSRLRKGLSPEQAISLPFRPKIKGLSSAAPE